MEADDQRSHKSRVSVTRLPWLLALLGVAGAIAAVLLSGHRAQSAAGQTWQPFVLVAGLLMVGIVANADGLFAAAGQALARLARSGVVLYAGAVALIVLVTTLLNLDTSVAFLTPILIYTSRSASTDEAPLMYASLLLANAGSLLLPGSNLTNLIVLGHLHLSGGSFLRQAAPAGIAAIVVTAAIVAVVYRRTLRTGASPADRVQRPVFRVGFAAILAVTVCVVALSAPALPVAVIGLVAVALTADSLRIQTRRVWEALNPPVLIGLFGVAVALGTLGRAWSGPAQLLSHLDSWATAPVAAIVSVLVNNLPAASLLASRVPAHPFALLVGLNIGPNLFVTGSLSWMLWWKAAQSADAEPSLARATKLGLITAPPAIAAAIAMLALTGSS